ncbi:molybdopterin-dependent oxidoreductase [Adlercreutzia caecimuris]|uniref:molybdopterin-dependent oxidoreductase n=1 Tax=Adlercreutzia caecimuris TaxID=671266 RepID=UPI0024947476|nr:molybdopterin-dependent oxidoreductase [Adlercreutzia caecimuris]
MNEATKKIAGTAGSLILLTSMGAGAAVAFADEAAPAPAAPEAAQAEGTLELSQATQAVVEGDFSFTQEAVSSNEAIAKAMRASAYLCANRAFEGEAFEGDVSQWPIAVGGDVERAFVATVEELQADPDAQRAILGCSCSGNPADGGASVNAEVTGVSVAMLLEKAGVSAEANTVVFRSADGYEVALPMRYITQHYCPVVFDVNGSPIAETVGGANQLWLGSTSARYFAKDIVSITAETRQTPPPAPGSEEAGDTYANLPNVGVFFGGDVA